MRKFWIIPAAFFLAQSLEAQTSYPMITHITPAAVQKGKTATITVEGQQNFYGAYKVLVEGAGVTAEVVDKPKPAPAGAAMPTARNVKVKVTVAADAASGVRDFRIITPLGPSSIGQLVISDHPVVEEKGDNNTREKAPSVPVPCVVSGRIEAAEDVDFYKFHAEAGQTFAFEVLCARIQDKIHDLQKHADPMLTLYDAAGRELAANDDFYFGDPFIGYTFTKAGDYFIQVRDSKYDGDPRWMYALLITDRPYATHIFPPAANPGQTVVVEPVGPAALVQPKVTLIAPSTPGIVSVPLDIKGMKTNPVPLIVSPLPQVIEQEPNDTPAQAQRVTLPCGISGRIATPSDLDHFVFKAAKGKPIRMEIKARRFGTPLVSSLDSVLEVLDNSGKVLMTNDDTAGKDAAAVFTPPADGDYKVRVRHLNNAGAPTAIYYLEIEEDQPDFTLLCDPDKAMIGPGSRTAWFVHVKRNARFTGPVKVEVKGMPPGVTVNDLTIPATMTQGLLVVSAAEDAPRGVTNVEIVGTATAKIDGKDITLTRVSVPNQEIYFPGGGRGRYNVNLQTVAVGEPTDILKVNVTPATVTLKPGQEVKLEVTLVRRPGFDKSVSLDIPLRHLGSMFGNPLPPGVTIVDAKCKTLLGAGSKGHIVLTAAANAAPIENIPICVMAHVSINFVVKTAYASPAVPVSVRK